MSHSENSNKTIFTSPLSVDEEGDVNGIKAETPSSSGPAMTPQQRKFSAQRGNPFMAYKELVAGDSSWAAFIGYEAYQVFFGNLSGLLGYASRSLVLPWFVQGGKGLAIGRGVNIRQPHQVQIGKKVVIEEYASLDCRLGEQQSSDRLSDRLSKQKYGSITLGDYVFIGRNSIVTARGGSISLGTAVNVSSNCRIATQSELKIGDSVLIAAYVYIGPGNHRIDKLDCPIMEQGMDLKGGVSIGANSWIGTRATILDGVKIGSDAVIGAHSLVMQDVPDRAIVAGTPAKIIRYRE